MENRERGATVTTVKLKWYGVEKEGYGTEFMSYVYGTGLVELRLELKPVVGRLTCYSIWVDGKFMGGGTGLGYAKREAERLALTSRG